MTEIDQPPPKNEAATARVSKPEKDALRLVSIWDETTESDLLRTYTIDQVVERAAEIRSMRPTAPAA